MADAPANPQLGERENWGSKIGVILAVAGSAVGLGNFLRFPGTAVNNGGGAFMIPYVICFLLIGVPIVWCEWTMGRLGGRYGLNNGAGIIFALWRKAPAKGLGALTILVPITVYMYYVLLEALCLNYAVDFFSGSLTQKFSAAVSGDAISEKAAVVSASKDYFSASFGLKENGSLFDGKMLWMVVTCFLVNFIIIYRGVTKGIESFCKVAMPLLVLCACVILVRAMTLDNISVGLGFMWNPNWEKLKDAEVWLQAAGQIFFSLSVGFGLILCYASYLRADDDVVLTSLSASSANEFCEVVLGGLIVVPTAFLFFGAEAATGGTFSVGFETIPAIMYEMPWGGRWFGGLWFGLLFLAGVTSSLSMLQPAIAFLEDGFGLNRRASVVLLALITTAGAALVMHFSKSAIALDFTDFACNFLMIVAGLAQVILFGWIIGADRGIREANRGADFPIPGVVRPLVRYVTPGFLIVVLSMWCYYNAPGYVQGMSPEFMSIKTAITEQFPDQYDADSLKSKVRELQAASAKHRPEWLTAPPEKVAEKMAAAQADAKVARFSILGVIMLLVVVVAAVDLACRGRIGRMIEQAEARGVSLDG